MARKKAVGRKPNGEEIFGIPVTPTGTQEYWSTYILEDGSQIKIKTVVHEILRVDGQYDPEGNPVYLVKSQQVVSVDAPEELRKKKE